MDVDVALTYLHYVTERHKVWEARQGGVAQPWTADPILRTRKFTNDYRVLDPGSQFVLTDLAPPWDTPRTVLARIFLYRYTNEPATWRYVRDVLGDYPDEMDLYQPHLLNTIISYREAGNRVFSGAYVILPQPNRPGDKVEQAVGLASRWMNSHAEAFLAATTQEERFAVLRREYGVGPFMAMQILTDWGYTPQCGEDREAEFVVPGPGCIKGAKFIAPSWPVGRTLAWATDAVHALPDCPVLTDPTGLTAMARPPSLMDIQNTFCEFSKYHRYEAKPVPAKEYAPAHPGPQPAPVLPAHW